MTRAEVEQRIDKIGGECGTDALHSSATNGPQRAAQARMVGGLLAALAFGGKDSMGRMCPVFARRLAGPGGQQLAANVRTMMRTYPDSVMTTTRPEAVGREGAADVAAEPEVVDI
jgi:hypothetical protein